MPCALTRGNTACTSTGSLAMLGLLRFPSQFFSFASWTLFYHDFLFPNSCRSTPFIVNIMHRGQASENGSRRIADRDVFQTIRRGRVHNFQPFHRRMLYEGCPIICANRKECELGKSARRERRRYGGLLDKMSRIWDHHVCVLVCMGVSMFNFIVKIDNLGDIDIF